ncbi:hypothetical protein AAAX56_00975 [Hominicoprocola fusiformis]
MISLTPSLLRAKRIPSDQGGGAAAAVAVAVLNLFHHMGQIFRDNAPAPSNPMGVRMDSKRRKKLMAKRLVLGHKMGDHENPDIQQTM